MSTNEHHISYATKGRFFTFGNPEKAKHLLIAIHGYSQLAAYFIRKFNVLNPDEYYVICPEGPHRFYQKETSGRVGASWMTKEDRTTDIDNYISFLDTIIGDINLKYDFTQSTLLGFSQGGATASRWIGYGKGIFDTFLLWAAVFPPDMDATAKMKFKTQKNYFVIGEQDEYSSLEQAKEYYKQLNTHEMPFEFVTFKGNHSIEIGLLQTLIK